MSKYSIFDLDFDETQAELMIIAAPWELSASFRRGSSLSPNHIVHTSSQIDAFYPSYPQLIQKGICYLGDVANLTELHDPLLDISQKYIQNFEKISILDTKNQSQLNYLNQACSSMISRLKKQISKQIFKKKHVGLIGGEHSITQAAVIALSEKFSSFSILQIDAHMDLRPSYQQLEHSHASVMYNCLKLPQIATLCQVGCRDFCQDEWIYAHQNHHRIHTFTDALLAESIFEGHTWQSQCCEIISKLDNDIYLTVDIDGLCPRYCPQTGTPVPGGLSFQQLCYLLKRLIQSKKRIIGFDLVEVVGKPDSLDCIVASHVLFQLSMACLHSQAANNNM